jgi:cytochrome c oxidase subunit 2
MISRAFARWIAVTLLGVLACLGGAGVGPARAADPTPPELQGVTVDERLGASIDLELGFTDHAGRAVRLRDYIGDGKPVILTLNYYRCPMLCNLQLNALTEGLRGLAWAPGEKFRVVTVSIDAREKPDLAAAKRASHLDFLGRGLVDWSFLVGGKESVESLARSVGYGYRYDPEQDQFAHPLAIVFLSPEGRVSRYLYGMEYASRDLKLGLLEASEGRVGSTVDRLVLSCFHYDPSRGRYAPYALGIMRLGGVVSVALLAGLLAALWRRERGRRGPVPAAALAPLGLVGPLMPQAASGTAQRFDALFLLVFWVSAFSFVLVAALTIAFAIRYRRRRAGEKTSPIRGDRRVEIVWSVIPAIILVVFFALGFRDYLDLAVPPANAVEVRVLAQQWSWSFDYPKEGVSSAELVLPVGRPVKLTMSSADVIHSFFVPAFRVKRDVLPNRYTVAWFDANRTGTFDVLCAEYCGTAHSQMLAKVRVVTEGEYRAWIESGGGLGGKGMSSVELGKLLFQAKGCATCHSTDGTRKIGPSLLARHGVKELLRGGSTVTVDDDYLRESIVNPNAKVVEGYAPVMPTYAGRLTDPQLNALVDYVKSLDR